MKERLPENNRPINRIAKEAMKRAQYSPDPSLMYCLQAAYECIQRGIIETRYPPIVGKPRGSDVSVEPEERD